MQAGLSNFVLGGMRERPELIILVLIVCIVAMLIVPLPTFLVDLLIGVNIVISILLFLGAFHIERILNFSSFPSMLLITTLFRLALSISTTRLILIDADAGKIIDTFGQFVIGDSLAVGFVVFSIVTIVQFIVIAKGSERVAEVAARFSLDGMPGKQMSIDADLKAGIINAEGARVRRSELERESQLYGSFDGAMKFVKGDAIAGIVIILVNLIGGIAVGVTQRGLDLAGAMTTYTSLTIGDGLVAQIPALLISVGAGFVVTRVGGDNDNMGRSIVRQLTGNRFVLAATAALSLLVGALPGFPWEVFVLLAATLAAMCYFTRPTSVQGVPKGQGGRGPDANSPLQPPRDESSLALIDNLNDIPNVAVPLVLIVHQGCADALVRDQFTARLRSQFFLDFGVQLPEVTLRTSDKVARHHVGLLINEVRADEFVVHFDRVRIVTYTPEIDALKLSPVESGPQRGKCAWVTPEQGALLSELNHPVRSPADELYRLACGVLSHNVNEYFGIQETKTMLDRIEDNYPDLIKEVLRHVTLQRITEILQRLVAERISVRNMKLILEVLALWAPKEKDVINLVEHVRGALGRYICHKFADGGELRAIMLSPETEDRVRRGIRQTPAGAFLNLDPADADDIVERIALAVDASGRSHLDLVLLAAVDIRRFIKKLMDSRLREVDVMSFGELVDGLSVNVLKTV
ncbi:EscV/YscV/HrcV family type III secretion system export apparatus protein [Pandoraea terrae]|uniref:EscV/YscV/HrcV family type III secretion system export apparatus protein n=1 Tax=Pandoraea terrae TaxID=1537710 RepID=A0A5E4T921_9BURK|nr:EscV/YscV/HrcV family type III secretion system export apparatus protein [Pandoraea terrae]VVD84590.1 EscV/YscV/HrcV family type III secretion system export apparatus protein [Pandoraea terrae]